MISELIASISFYPEKIYSFITSFAHCPLCTGGAGAAAAVATMLGVKYGATAVFIGAFATALGLWITRKIKKQYIKGQRPLLFIVVYLSTLIPIYPFIKGDYTSKFISIRGDYGSWLNKTYLIDMFFIGALIGTIIMFISPKISSYISQKRDKTIRFQGIIITFILLVIAGVFLQYWPRW